MIDIQGGRRVRLMGTLCGLILSLLFSHQAMSAPADLAQWSQWLRQQQPELECPRLPASRDQSSERLCLWPGELRLDLEAGGAGFHFRAEVLGSSGLVPLPGDSQSWPAEIEVDGRTTAPVVEKNGLPWLALDKGRHTVKGQLAWNRQPAFLAVPASFGLVTAYRDGKWQPLQRSGVRLLLAPQQSGQPSQQRDSLSVEVYRRLIDGVPVKLETQLVLSVSGNTREVVLGPVVPDNTLPLGLQSPLPARLEPDGRLRVQVSSGVHRLILNSRYTQAPEQYQSPALGTQHWPAAEFVSFQEYHAYRTVKITGARSVDTSQLDLPGAWRQLATYRVDRDSQLTIRTDSRGDLAPAANEVRVSRDLWLDFDGGGITSLDRIHGNMRQGWRLDAAPGVRVGRASANDRPLLITTHDGLEGLEIRSPSINVEAVTRIDGRASIPAVGWGTQAESLSASLHLPPAWKALYVSGAERVHGTWISDWNLWEVFLTMVIVAATRRLFNLRVAALAAVSFLLALQEPESPLTLIPVLLVLLAVATVANDTVKRLLWGIGALTSAALVLILLQFAVESFRLAIYPSLERTAVGDYQKRVSEYTRSGSLSFSAADEAEMQVTAAPSKMKMERYEVDKAYDPTDVEQVQTGPGQPAWTWRSVSLRFSGPVSAAETVGLYLLPPWATSLWRILMVLSSALLSAVVIERFIRVMAPSSLARSSLSRSSAKGVAMLLMLGASASMLPDRVEAQSYPPQHLMEKLEQELQKPPTCWPDCVGINGGKLSVQEDRVMLTLDVYAATQLAFKLPVAQGGMQWSDIRSGSQVVPLAAEGGDSLAQLGAGHHRLQLQGRIAGDSWSLRFPLSVHRLDLQAPRWTVSGWVDGSVDGGSLSFQREARQQQDTEVLINDPAPALVSVVRRLDLGRQWEVSTSVTRLAPASEAFSVRIPLLDNEQLLSPVGDVEEGGVTLHFRPGQSRLVWASRLEPVDTMTLRAPESLDSVEIWTITPSDRWRLRYEGLAANRHEADETYRSTFQPRPGEMLSITASMPPAVAGPTHTIESLKLSHHHGGSLQKSTLDMSILASLAEDYRFELPEGAVVTSLTYAGKTLNLPEGEAVVVPLLPGEHPLSISFQQTETAHWLRRSPVIDLGEEAANVRIAFTLPQDQWPLAIAGPAIGPAMLYWGVLCVILLGALLLARMARQMGLDVPIGLGGWILLGLGLSTVNSYGVLLVALCVFAMALRRRYAPASSWSAGGFNGVQVGLLVLSLIALISLVSAIPMGLLSDPQMKVVGNASSSHVYNYYQDRTSGERLPQVVVWSLPLMVYRVAMLLWSLWLATRLLHWVRWGWECYREGGAWKKALPASQAKAATAKPTDSSE